MADIEHSESLIDADDSPGSQALRHGPGHAARARRHIKNLLIPLQREHIDQLLSQISANLRGAAVKFGRVLRIMKVRFVIVLVSMAVLMMLAVIVPLSATFFVSVFVPGVVVVVVFVAVFMFVFVCHYFFQLLYRPRWPSVAILRFASRACAGPLH
jgi:fatty acid desaturase